MMLVGMTMRAAPFNPHCSRIAVTRPGPMANPSVPPTPNTLMAVAFLSPATRFTNWAPWG